MPSWTYISHNLLVLVLLAFFGFGIALFLYDGLRLLFRNFRAWRAKSASQEDFEARAGPFHLNKPPSAVQRRYAHKHEVKVTHHWNCSGKWTPRH